LFFLLNHSTTCSILSQFSSDVLLFSEFFLDPYPAANKWYQLSRSYTTLESIHYTRRQKSEFGAMEPNLKLVLEEMAKLRAEMKECFTNQEVAFSKRIDTVAADGKICDTHSTNYEEAAATFDKSFIKWQPGWTPPQPPSSWSYPS
jgi:hypothetical protein